MTTLDLNRNIHKFVQLGDYAIHVVIADALLWSASSALFGIVIGGFGANARDELTWLGVVSIGGTFALVGFAIGILFGISGEISRLRNPDQNSSEMANRTAAGNSSRAPDALVTNVIKNPLMVISSKRKSGITALGS